MNEAKAGCVLRLFGAPDAAVGAAVGQFPPQWKAAAQWKSRGAETLVALSAQSAAGLKKAVGALRETFSADLYGAGETTLAEAVVAALEGHDRAAHLLGCGGGDSAGSPAGNGPRCGKGL